MHHSVESLIYPGDARSLDHLIFKRWTSVLVPLFVQLWRIDFVFFLFGAKDQRMSSYALVFSLIWSVLLFSVCFSCVVPLLCACVF